MLLRTAAVLVVCLSGPPLLAQEQNVTAQSTAITTGAACSHPNSPPKVTVSTASGMAGKMVLCRDGVWVDVPGNGVDRDGDGRKEVWSDGTYVYLDANDDGSAEGRFDGQGVYEQLVPSPDNTRGLELVDNGTSCKDPASGSTSLCTIAGEPHVRDTGGASREILWSGGGDYGSFRCSGGVCTVESDAVGPAELAPTGVVAGSYTAADITVDADGRITAAASGSGGGGGGGGGGSAGQAYAETVEGPTGTTDRILFRTSAPTRIDALHAALQGGISVSWDLVYARTANASDVGEVLGNDTVTGSAAGTSVPPSSPLIPKDSWVRLKASAASGSPSALFVQVATSPGASVECSDGVDNETPGDGRIDHPADPDCSSAEDTSEATQPACSDGRDNDADGAVDYPADPGCSSADDGTEENASSTSRTFDGRVTNRLDSCSTTNRGVTGDKTYTVCAWIRTAAVGGRVYTEAWELSSSYNTELLVGDGSQGAGSIGKAVCGYRGGGDGFYAFSAGGRTVADDAWHHVCCEGDGTSLRSYVDGNLEATHSTGFALEDTMNGSCSAASSCLDQCTIGALRRGPTPSLSGPFDGQVAHVELWDTNVGPTVIQSAMSGPGCQTSRQFALWHLDGTGGIEPDESAGGTRPMTVVGTVPPAPDVPVVDRVCP